MFYVNENLPCKSLTTEPDNLTEINFLGVNVQSSKWLFVGCYKPSSQNEEFFISNLSKTINAFSTKYDNILLMVDFNLTIENKHLEELLNLFNLKSLILSLTYFQSTNPTCIDLVLTNQEDLFNNSNTCEVGIPDNHYLVLTMLNKKNSKAVPKLYFIEIIRSLIKNKFTKDLTHELQYIKNSSYNQFQKLFVTVFDNHVPLKKKQLRFNNRPFMTKALQKAIMMRSRLKTLYNKKRSYGNWDKYEKQRNFYVKLRCKTKQECFNNIDIKSVSDTKKTAKPYFSNKGLNFNKIFLSEKRTLIKDPVVIATTMNDYFANITQTIGLKQFQFDHAKNLFEDHTSIIRIKSNLNNVSDKFDFKKCMKKTSNGKS